MGKWRAHVLRGCLAIGLTIAATQHAVAGDPPNPDVIVSGLSNPINHGPQNTTTGLINAFSFGTQSCNIGDDPIRWQELPSVHHPVIRIAMYRLKNARFEQIGFSWVKHGYFATNDPECGYICTAPGNHDGTALYPGCSDPYGPSINAYQPNLGPSWQINAYTGGFSLPVVHPSGGNAGRLQVHNVDLDPAQNPGARYYVDAMYVSGDDAAAGNGYNNASYQRGNVVSAPANLDDSCTGIDPLKYCFFLTDSLNEEEPAIHAWKAFDPSVVETIAQVPGEGRFILAAKATGIGAGFWRYEYALYNMNSDRSGKSFTIPYSIGASIQNAGFHDVEYHSGEPFDNTDWAVNILSGKIIWSSQDFTPSDNANALRWGTIYNFRFECNVPPGLAGATTVTLNLFKPGAPDKINIPTIGPVIGFIDCNNNGEADSCDVSCEGVGCDPPCGGYEDCNSNNVPDECEEDCNNNNEADTCDISSRCVGGADAGKTCSGNGDCESNDCAPRFSLDCNSNTVPDECEEDCNENGIPDNCEEIPNCDGDNVNDCDDLCRCTTPPNGCDPPVFVCCQTRGGIAIPNYPYYACLSESGTPLCDAEFPGDCFNSPIPCPTSFCRQGCLVGDGDGDGDIDFNDYNELMHCFSGDQGAPAFVMPSEPCLRMFDFDENDAVDLGDVEQFRRELAGPVGP